MASEEEKVLAEEQNTEVLTAFNRIPYALISHEVDGGAQDVLHELTEICGYYRVYKKGAKFTTEGANGDYVPAQLRYKMAASLINKEARFLFAEPPDITIKPKGDVGKTTQETKDNITTLDDLVSTVLEKNKFEDALIKAAKDCFIGKRVAALVNLNPEDGITITFLPSTQFLYETKLGNNNVITKFVAFIVVKDAKDTRSKRIFKKKFELDESGNEPVVYLEEELFDGAGAPLETITERQPIEMTRIPVSIFINDGLTGEEQGDSEIELLKYYEQYYSKLSNADIDANRKSMNPTKYVVDMDSRSTKNLSTAAGALWDMGSDQNLDNPHPLVGLLEPAMSYSDALKTTLDRIKTVGYEQVDMPNITLESMTGAITSGKALKAIYWPLIVRCKEKMKMWGPQLKEVINIIIDGVTAYPEIASRYISVPVPVVEYEIEVAQNLPLPEDEIEERTMDLAEVESCTMSKKTYMMKWRGLTDDQVEEELAQIALERQIVEDSAFNTGGGSGGSSGNDLPYPDDNPEDVPQDGNDITEEF